MGLFGFLNKKKGSLSIEEFCEELRSNLKIDVVKSLDLPFNKFTKADKYDLKSNPDDVRNGVVEVNYLNHSLNVFGIYTSCVIKTYNTGRKQYFFHTTTDDSDLVIKIADMLYEKFGQGIYDDRINSTFRNKEKVINISKELGLPTKDECVTMWSVRDNVSLWLQYRLNPMKQFIFNIDENVHGLIQ